MDTEVQDYKMYNEINGIRFLKVRSTQDIKSSLENNGKKEFDLILASYPKSETTLLSHIVYLILNNGNPGGNSFGYKFYEHWVSDFDSNKDTHHVMLTHLPIIEMPHKNNKTKFIFVLRNPKDVVVSYYYFAKQYPYAKYKGDFHQFFDLWINGEVPYGDYFDHIREWLPYRNNINYLFVFYENLIQNIREEITKIARFIDKKFKQKLLANNYNNTYMENVLKHSSFEHLKAQATAIPFIFRKGIIGDWRNHFTQEESEIIDNKMNEKLGDTDLIDIWKNDMKWQNKNYQM